MLNSVRQVWALEKDESIKHLLILLFGYFGEGELVASADELCNDRAISLMHKHDRTVRVYIYTYGHDSGRYGVHVEYPIAPLPYPLNTPESYENVSFEQLTGIIELNLNIVTVEMSV